MITVTSRRHRVAGVVAAAATTVSLISLGAPAEAVGSATVMPSSTQKMRGPALPPTYTQAGTYAKGQRLTLSCYSRGQSVQGYYSPYLPNGGWDNLWYKVSDGYWVADVDINTGSNNPVAPACSTSSRKWGQTRSSNIAPAGQCTDGAYRQFKAYSGVYPALTGNAKDWYNSARATGWSTSLDAQSKSIVVFQPGVQGADPTYGHVAWVTGVTKKSDGLYVSIVEFNYLGQGAVWHSRTVKDVPGMSYVLAPPPR